MMLRIRFLIFDFWLPIVETPFFIEASQGTQSALAFFIQRRRRPENQKSKIGGREYISSPLSLHTLSALNLLKARSPE